MQPVRGTKDLFGEDAYRFRLIQNTALEVARRFQFQEFQTPIFEFTEVFSRTLGDTSDIVSKEMYTFTDRGGESLTLRPEGTAGVARSFISEGLSQELPLKLIYMGPMFRYERPQKGRLRQFHQVGIEILGVDQFLADVEAISFGHILLKELGVLDKCELHLNSIGDKESRTLHREKLLAYLEPQEKHLSKESQQRLKSNPLRILDSKSPEDQKICEGAPQLSECLTPLAKTFFENVQSHLKDLKIDFILNPNLVRGLDYYTHSVFEYRTSHIGSQDAVLAGGRYDHLIATMGGPATPGVGWASGMERLSLLLNESKPKTKIISLIPLGDEAIRHATELSHSLRSEGLDIDLSFSGNLQKRLKKANRAEAHFAVIFGDDELKKSLYQVKDLKSGNQHTMTREQLHGILKQPDLNFD